MLSSFDLKKQMLCLKIEVCVISIIKDKDSMQTSRHPRSRDNLGTKSGEFWQIQFEGSSAETILMLSVCRTAVLQYLQSVSQHCMHLGMLQDRIDVQTDPCNAVLAGIYISVECMQYLVLCTIVGALQFCLSWRQPAARLQQSQVPNCSTRPHCRPGLQQS